jgi:hypothetical protein
MKNLVIIANLGALRAFRVRPAQPDDPEHLEEFALHDAPEPIQPMREQLSD